MRGPAINAGVSRGIPAPKREPRPPTRGGRGGRAGQGGGGGRGSGENYLKREQNSVTAPPTWKTINRNVRASTNLKFRPLERTIGSDIRASKQRQGEVGDWWQNYLNTVAAGQADTSAAYQQAGATQQAQMGQASAIDTANTARLQAEGARSAEERGAAPSLAPAEREAAAQAQRNYLATAQAGSTALSGAIQRGYLNQQRDIGAGQSIKSRQEEQARERGFRKDRRETRKERGEYATTKRGEEQAEARKYQIQRGAFGLDKKKAAQEAREGNRSANEKARHESNEERRKNEAQRNENQEQANQNRKAQGEAGKKHREAQAELKTEIRKAGALLRRAEAGEYTSPASAVDYLVEKGISPRAAKQAVRRAEAQAKARAKKEVAQNYPHR